jgi:hypothetical protein
MHYLKDIKKTMTMKEEVTGAVVGTGRLMHGSEHGISATCVVHHTPVIWVFSFKLAMWFAPIAAHGEKTSTKALEIPNRAPAATMFSDGGVPTFVRY